MGMAVQDACPLTSWPHPSRPIQSYCLKVKEMDDEEYSCIVSTQGAHVVAGWFGVPTSPAASEGLSGILGA